MAITLQGTVDFSAAFLQRLPAIEQTMVAQGLEPGEFVISKDAAATANMRPLGPFFYDYTVFVDGEHFTVTEPNDERFLEFFYRRVTALDEEAPARRADTLLRRFVQWMNGPI